MINDTTVNVESLFGQTNEVEKLVARLGLSLKAAQHTASDG